MNLSTHIAAEEAHTRKLAALPAWREYITDKAATYAKKQPALYGHLPQVVAETINQEKANEHRG
jgi:hypothetical protein